MQRVESSVGVTAAATGEANDALSDANDELFGGTASAAPSTLASDVFFGGTDSAALSTLVALLDWGSFTNTVAFADPFWSTVFSTSLLQVVDTTVVQVVKVWEADVVKDGIGIVAVFVDVGYGMVIIG